jgi:hypothetical protein
MGSISLASWDMLVLGASGLFVGMRRSGVQGGAVLAVVLLASHFSAAASVGITVVVFLLADIQVTAILFPKVDWRLLGKLLGPTLLGLAVGVLFGSLIAGPLFEWVLFAIILSAYAGLLYQRSGSTPEVEREAHPVLTLVAGFLSGFTSMVGNLASLFVAVYFAAIGSKKEKFIATSAWFFFTINLIKLPIHIWVWDTIRWDVVLTTLIIIPVVSLGIWLGRVIVTRLEERGYWRFVLVVVGVGILHYFYGLVSGG